MGLAERLRTGRTLTAWKLDDGTKLVFAARVPLEYRPKITNEGLVVVPDDARERAEGALRTLADLIAISDRSRRSLQAAYDVLLNKATWRDPSTARRAVWTPQIALTNSSGTEARVFASKHDQVKAEATSDWWAVSPVDFASNFTTQPKTFWPPSWWPWAKSP